MTRRLLIFFLLVFILAGCTARQAVSPAVNPQGINENSAVVSTATEWVLPSVTPEKRGTADAKPAWPSPTVASRTQSPSPSATRTGAALRTPQPAGDRCSIKTGRVVTATLETRLLRLPLTYRVYLPPCYDEHPDERFPSLYLFHGQSYTDDQWDRMGADETADRLIAAGKISPLIIVMPYDRYGGQPTETGFSDAVVKQLIPAIDAAYRTRPERSYRAVGGLSRGAGWAIHFGIGYWEMFGRVGAHSAAVFHTDAQRLRTWFGKIPPEEYPQVYLDIGDRDRPEIMRSTLWFEDLLNLYDVPHEWHLFSGYHSEEYWSGHMEDYLLWYARDW